MPVVAFPHDGTPQVAVRADDLTQRGCENRGIGERLLDSIDHSFETVDLGRQFLAAGLRTFDSEAKLEVFLVADQDVGDVGDFLEDLVKLLFAVLPERGAVVQIEGDPGAVFLCGSRDFQTEGTCLGRQRGN